MNFKNTNHVLKIAISLENEILSSICFISRNLFVKLLILIEVDVVISIFFSFAIISDNLDLSSVTNFVDFFIIGSLIAFFNFLASMSF